jgi:hypothetical protein
MAILPWLAGERKRLVAVHDFDGAENSRRQARHAEAALDPSRVLRAV